MDRYNLVVLHLICLCSVLEAVKLERNQRELQNMEWISPVQPKVEK